MERVRQFLGSQFRRDEPYWFREKAMEAVEKIVYTHPFLKKLNPDYFHILEECASFVRFGVGQPLFQADSDAEYFYLIHQGSVGLDMFVRGKGVITIQTIGAGEALGWSWLLPPYRWHFSARSHAATEAVAFAAPVLRQLCDSLLSDLLAQAIPPGQFFACPKRAFSRRLHKDFFGWAFEIFEEGRTQPSFHFPLWPAIPIACLLGS